MDAGYKTNHKLSTIKRGKTDLFLTWNFNSVYTLTDHALMTLHRR